MPVAVMFTNSEFCSQNCTDVFRTNLMEDEHWNFERSLITTYKPIDMAWSTRKTESSARSANSYCLPKKINWLVFNPLNTELNPIFYLLALLGAHHFLHVSRIMVKLLTFRRLMSYVYGAPILDVSRSHTKTHHSW